MCTTSTNLQRCVPLQEKTFIFIVEKCPCRKCFVNDAHNNRKYNAFLDNDCNEE